MGGMAWILDLMLIGLLAMTLYHALRLERALGVLKRDRAALDDLVRGFNHATAQAEGGVDRLRAAAEGAGRALSRQVEAAQTLKDDLGFLVGRGEKLADQMDHLVRAARGTAERLSVPPEPPRPAPSWHTAPPPQPEPPPALHMAAEAPADVPVLRSQAERDLARALRLVAR